MRSRPAESKGLSIARFAVLGMIAVTASLGLSGTATAAEPGPIGGVPASPSAPALPAAPATPSDSATAPAGGANAVTAPSGNVWDRLARCESGGNWRINSGNGYYGGLQFSPRTWRAHGGQGMPHTAGRDEQIRVAQRVVQTQGWRAWPSCSRKLGLRG